MSTDLRFWMVWREGGPHPSTKHEISADAYAEAARLAAKHPGNRFVILEAIGEATGAVYVTQRGLGPTHHATAIVTPPMDWDPKTGRILEGPQG